MGFDDQLWSHLVREHAADRLQRPVGSRARSRRMSRRARWLIGLSSVAAIAVPAGAYAAGAFTSPRTEAASLPNGATLFAGTRPTCTVVRPGIAYRCKLAKPPTADTLPQLTERQQDKIILAPPGFHYHWVHHKPYVTRRQNEQDVQYQVKLLLGWGWNKAQALEYATGDIPGFNIRPGQFLGKALPTVDAAHIVTGGCRSTSTNGTTWDCYIGKTAVQEKVVAPPNNRPYVDYLGSRSPGPLR